MSEHDRRGRPLATTSAAAAEGWRAGLERLLTAQPGAAVHLRAALAEDPAFAEAGTALALALLLEQDLAAGAVLAAAGRLAGAHGGRDGPRLRSQVALVGGLATLDVAAAAGEGRRHLLDHPLDDVAREAVGLTLFLAGRGDDLAALYEEMAPDQGADWAFASARSFARHEVGDLDRSRSLAEASLAARPGNAFAVHSLAHVAYESGDHDGGSALLARFTSTYDPTALQYRHLHWHRALHALALGHGDEVAALWRRAVAPGAVPTAFSRVEDGAGLLWRCHLRGLDGWDRAWDQLAGPAAEVAAAPRVPLVAACAVVVLAALGDQATLDRLLAAAADLAARGAPVPVEVLAAVAAAATASFAADWEGVATALGPVRGELGRLGGSRAQREVFDDAFLTGLVLGGRGDEALPVLAERLARRPSGWDTGLLDRAGTGPA